MTTDWSGVADTFLEYLKTDDCQLCRELLDPILLNLLEPQGKTILDVGCGEGYFTRVLKAAGVARVVGVDISPGLIKRAEEQDALGEYQVHDIVFSPAFSPLTFDAAIANIVMMYVSDLNAAYQGISEFLAPSGRLIVSIVNPYYGAPVGKWGWTLPVVFDDDFDPRNGPMRAVLRQLHDVWRRNFSYILFITDYFGSRLVQKTLSGSTKVVPHFHRQLSDYINVAAKHRLVLSSLLEPQISPELQQRFAGLGLAQALARVPLFLILVFNKAS